MWWSQELPLRHVLQDFFSAIPFEASPGVSKYLCKILETDELD